VELRSSPRSSAGILVIVKRVLLGRANFAYVESGGGERLEELRHFGAPKIRGS